MYGDIKITSTGGPLNLNDLIQGLEFQKITHPEMMARYEIKEVTSDSRRVSLHTLFVAIKGFSSDGHQYISEVIKQGCRAIIVEESVQHPSDVVQISVTDSRLAMAKIASNIFGHPSKELVLVGVTGTNGKTTSTYLLESILNAQGLVTGVIGTINYRYLGKILEAPNTTPESTDFQKLLRQMKNEGLTHVVMEVSSHALKLKRVDASHFDVALFTNLTQDHMDFHGDFTDYFESKKRLFTELLDQSCKKNTASVVNIDDFYGQKIWEELKGRKKAVISFSIHSKNKADVYPHQFEFNLKGLEADIRTPQGKLQIHSPLLGEHNLYNILGVIGVSQALGLSMNAIQNGIENLKNVPGRLERVEAGQTYLVLVDYAHTDDALKNVGKAIGGLTKDRIITVFGCGGDRDRKKRPLMAKAASEFSDHVIVTSDNPRTENPQKIIEDILVGFREINASNFEVEPDRKRAIGKAIQLANVNDIVLIAGKGHEDYQILGKTKIHFDDREVANEAICSKQKKL